jgi:hypothetical protein
MFVEILSSALLYCHWNDLNIDDLAFGRQKQFCFPSEDCCHYEVRKTQWFLTGVSHHLWVPWRSLGVSTITENYPISLVIKLPLLVPQNDPLTNQGCRETKKAWEIETLVWPIHEMEEKSLWILKNDYLKIVGSNPSQFLYNFVNSFMTSKLSYVFISVWLFFTFLLAVSINSWKMSFVAKANYIR